MDVDIAVFTNLASDPAEAGGTPEQLLAAWGAVFRRLTNPSRQRAIINLDGAVPRAFRSIDAVEAWQAYWACLPSAAH